MNAATARAIEQLKEARETLGRSLDDPTLTPAESALIQNIYLDIHTCSLSLAFLVSDHTSRLKLAYLYYVGNPLRESR